MSALPARVRPFADPAFYLHRPDSVELMQTHISWVFLAGEYVYKVKKPVNLGFLDFRTLARRRHFCREEVRLNQRLAPNAYLDVVSVTRAGGASSRRRGRAKRAVWMRRLPASECSIIVEAGGPIRLMGDIGRTIADFRAALAAPSRASAGWRVNAPRREPRRTGRFPAVASARGRRAMVTLRTRRSATSGDAAGRCARASAIAAAILRPSVCAAIPRCSTASGSITASGAATLRGRCVPGRIRTSSAGPTSPSTSSTYIDSSGDYAAVPLLDLSLPPGVDPRKVWVSGR
jgi:hypothetical protein